MITLDRIYAGGHCLHCGRWIFAWTAYQWAQVVAAPCPHCQRPGW